MKKKAHKFTRPTTALKQKKVLDNFAENGGNMRQAILSAGYSQEVADNPQKILNSKTFQEILEHDLSDQMLSEKHLELLNSSRLDHMVFPLGQADDKDPNFSGGRVSDDSNREVHAERTSLTDKEIIEMLAEVNCKVRRIVHGETARHVYFWAADNMARDKALDKAYKLKGRYMDEPGAMRPVGNTYNFIFSAPVQEKVQAIEGEIKKMLTDKPKNV